MTINITTSASKDGQKLFYKFEFGRLRGQRVSTGLFTYANPKNQIEKDYNKQTLTILELKKSQLILEHQAAGTGLIPGHKQLTNFFDFYQQYIRDNRRIGNRHLECSLHALKDFHQKQILAPAEITEEFVTRFRQYLLDRLNGETPLNYFGRFKRVLKHATKLGYFRISPAFDVKAKSNRNFNIKEIIEQDEFQKMVLKPCGNDQVKRAFIFCFYTGLRWTDVKSLKWDEIRPDFSAYKIYQNKTGVPLERPLHKVAREMLGERKKGYVFSLPTSEGANKWLKLWAESAGIQKHITWHCARHSFSVILQDSGVDAATVAGMLGHLSVKLVLKVYQRYRATKALEAIAKFPDIRLS